MLWCSNQKIVAIKIKAVYPIRRIKYVLTQNVFRSELIKVILDKIPLRVPRYPKLFYDQIPNSKFIHCNKSRAEEFRNKYGVKESHDDKAFKQEALALLTEASKVLSELGMRFWLSSGTCLGKN